MGLTPPYPANSEASGWGANWGFTANLEVASLLDPCAMGTRASLAK